MSVIRRDRNARPVAVNAPARGRTPPAVSGGEPADRRRWRALAVVQLAAFMVLLDVSIVNVALPSVERELAVAPATAQWVVSGYALALGLTLVPGGRLGDSLGRRRMFLLAVAAFALTSALTGAAPNAGLLIAARLVQGVAGGLLIPQNAGLVQELFRGADRGRAFGFIGATAGLATAAGPVLGGLILSVVGGADSWRWVFYINVPIGVAALLLAARLLPAGAGRGWRELDIDLVGSLLLGAAVLSLLLPVVEIDSGRFGRLSVLWALAALLLPLFAWWELRTARQGRQPLLDLQLARTPGYSWGVGIGLVYFLGFTGIWLVFALYLQDGLGYSPLRSGLSVTPFALGVAVSAVVAGRLVSRIGRWVTVCGLTATVGGLLVTALVLRHAGGTGAEWAVLGPLLLAGLGGGMVTSPNLTLTLQNVPVRMAGVAGGAAQTAQRVGASIGTATLATIFYHALLRTHGYPSAISDTLLAAAGFMLLALLMALTELALGRRRGSRPAPEHQPDHQPLPV